MVVGYAVGGKLRTTGEHFFVSCVMRISFPFQRTAMNRFVIFFFILVPTLLIGQEKPSLQQEDRVRIAEAFRLAERVGNTVWESWDKAPFAFLLVTPEYEFLLHHPNPSDDFLPLGYDEFLKTEIRYRKRVYSPQLLATFPAVNGEQTIVIGQAENTMAKSSTPWVVVALHEHFHQLQYARPDYYPDVEKLQLSRGDQSGMWMLNYPFPYDSAVVTTAFSRLCSLLTSALKAREGESLRSEVDRYLEARREFKNLLTEDDYRYFSFQLWQEGIARYTEYRVAGLASKGYVPSSEFQKLPDFTPFDSVAENLRKGIIDVLPTVNLAESKRSAFYPFGAAEGLLLDAVNPGWQEEYFRQKFDLEKYFR